MKSYSLIRTSISSPVVYSRKKTESWTGDYDKGTSSHPSMYILSSIHPIIHQSNLHFNNDKKSMINGWLMVKNVRMTTCEEKTVLYLQLRFLSEKLIRGLASWRSCLINLWSNESFPVDLKSGLVGSVGLNDDEIVLRERNIHGHKKQETSSLITGPRKHV